MEISQVILQYTLTTVMVILVGLIIGGGLGILIAWVLRLVYRAVPSLRTSLMIIPWRTLLFGSVLLFCSPMPILLILSVPPEQGAVIYPTLAFILIVFCFVAENALNHWLAASPAVRWAGLARTLAVACCVIVAISANAAGSGILMYARGMVASTFRPDAYWTALGVVMGLELLFDLLLGLLQMLLANTQARQAAKPAAPVGGN